MQTMLEVIAIYCDATVLQRSTQAKTYLHRNSRECMGEMLRKKPTSGLIT